MTGHSSKALETDFDSMPDELAEIARAALERVVESGALDVDNWSTQDRSTFCRLLACSDYATGVMRRQTAWLCESVAAGRFDAPPAASYEYAGDKEDEAAIRRSLRQYRHRTLTHIMWRDFSGQATLEESLHSLSALADEMLNAASELAARVLDDRLGRPRNDKGEEIPLVILAMGKLGGGELNFSSDVDVIFLYPESGDTDGRRALSAHEYFTRRCQRLVKYLDDVTEDGFVYRVDTRLRPFGDSGPPVVSFSALESYLLQHGRNWERYAYVKARVVGGDSTVSTELAQLIRPFVYRRYLDYGVFESLREMKSLIEAEVQKRELADNIKLGPGGIREIEFVIQSLQLVRGGQDERLQVSSLIAALAELRERGLLQEDSASELEYAYRFLRVTENYLQMIGDHQVHDLPADPNSQARLALAMGFDGWNALSVAIEEQRAIVTRRFREVVFRNEGVATHAGDDGFAAAWRASADAEEWRTLLQEHGVDTAQGFAEQLVAFRHQASAERLDAAAGQRLAALIPGLLSELAGRDNAAQVFHRVTGVLEGILRRSAYIALLNENRPVLARLVDICERSAFLAAEIARYPALLDEMFDPRLFTAMFSAADMQRDLDEQLATIELADSEARIEALARFQRATMFRIAVADFSNLLPIMKVSDALTELAEVVIQSALATAWRDLVARHGRPYYQRDGVERGAGFGIAAYGKMGGIELSYGSDLDLVFLHDSPGSGAQTDGATPIDNGMFYGRLVRRLVHFLTTQTPSGALYEVDTRLRPSGRSGLLVTNTDAFERYQDENAWTWEHQALLRARPVAGSVDINREFSRIRAETLRNRVNREALAEDVRTMRERMQKQLDRGDAESFDLKQGIGGIGELEFVVQYLVLKNAAQHPAVIFYTDNIRQLGTLGASGCLDPGDVSRLQEIYRSYRRRLHRLALDGQKPLVPDTEFTGERGFVRQVWERELG